MAVSNGVWCRDEAALRAAGAELAGRIDAPAVVTLSGDLGAGKTVFARGLIHALGYGGIVRSPTYTLVERYSAGGWSISHLDLYRLTDPAELELIGFRDLLAETDLLLIEWPERAVDELPEATVEVRIAHADTGRLLYLRERVRTVR